MGYDCPTCRSALKEAHRNGCMKQTPLSKRDEAVKLERQIAGGFSGGGMVQQVINYLLLYTKSRNDQLCLSIYQLVDLGFESHIRHFDLKYIRDEFRPSCLQSGQTRPKRCL